MTTPKRTYTKRPLAERFTKYVDKTGTDCHLWTGTTTNGYGYISVDGKMTKAHRVAYTLAYGPIPDGLDILHRCDTTRCVRPDHLFPGTHAQNMEDKMLKGRQAKGESHGMAVLTADQVRSIRLAHSTGEPYASTARRMNLSYYAVYQAATGRRWAHIETPSTCAIPVPVTKLSDRSDRINLISEDSTVDVPLNECPLLH
jgi:hypothetical protein